MNRRDLLRALVVAPFPGLLRPHPGPLERGTSFCPGQESADNIEFWTMKRHVGKLTVSQDALDRVTPSDRAFTEYMETWLPKVGRELEAFVARHERLLP